jgi:hypothetical protein
MSFVLNEDEALKQHLAGLMYVSDDYNTQRPVSVYYGMPNEEIREKKFPFVSLDLVDVAPDLSRARSGPYKHNMPYVPDGQPVVTAPNTDYKVMQLPPQPYALTYQISVFSRIPQHDRQLIGMMARVLPYQFGWVTVPADGTIRRLDVTGFTKRDMLGDNNKRTFRNVYTVRMSSELFLWQLQAIPTVWSRATVSFPALHEQATVTAH